MANNKKLDLEEDLPFQNTEWRIQRIGWAVWALVILAALRVVGLVLTGLGVLAFLITRTNSRSRRRHSLWPLGTSVSRDEELPEHCYAEYRRTSFAVCHFGRRSLKSIPMKNRLGQNVTFRRVVPP